MGYTTESALNGRMQAWLFPILLALATSMGGWAWNSTQDKLESHDRTLTRLREKTAAVDAIVTTQYGEILRRLDRIEASIDNEHRR